MVTRYFWIEIKSGVLKYYVDETKNELKGEYHITRNSVLQEESQTEKHKFLFSITGTAHHGKWSQLLMNAEMDQDRIKWMEVLSEVIFGVKIFQPDIYPLPFHNSTQLNVKYPPGEKVFYISTNFAASITLYNN